MRNSPTVFALVLAAATACLAQSNDSLDTTLSLSGAWYLAIDPLHRGEELGWHKLPEEWEQDHKLPTKWWEKVEVPHCWSVDVRWADMTRVWYRRAFTAPPVQAGEACRLQFGPVFYQCRIWLNGQPVGTHEGGYLPFELDVTDAVAPGEPNMIAVEVDNSWGIHTIPGGRTGADPKEQLYAWWNFGGILDDVRLVVTPAVFIRHQKIETTIDSTSGDAQLKTVVYIENRSDKAAAVKCRAEIRDRSQQDNVAEGAGNGAEIPPGQIGTIELAGTVPAGKVRRWSVDHPNLYQWKTMLSLGYSGEAIGERTDVFGIRTLEIRDARFLLNGEPVWMAGANRVMDHPQYGALEPPALIEQDMSLLKNAHMTFARLQHYPCSERLLDWADEHGMLIIAEAGCWGFPEDQLADPVIREKYKAQMGDMIRQQWNHPCIVGWSVGNEYDSWLPEGVAWTKDMKAFTRTLDDTRPIVFVGLWSVFKQDHRPREERSLHYSDIMCVNCYGPVTELPQRLDRLHELWPEKPIFITEYGKRADRVENEQVRIDHLRDMLAVLRERPFVCGLSYWAFNDYRSRYPGTAPNGYRPWGIIEPDRTPRALYNAMVEEFAPATVAAKRTGDEITVEVDCRPDFPTHPLQEHTLVLMRVDSGKVVAQAPLSEVGPGGSARTSVKLPTGLDPSANMVVLLKDSSGFTVVSSKVETK